MSLAGGARCALPAAFYYTGARHLESSLEKRELVFSTSV